jgi:hypothetical protein
MENLPKQMQSKWLKYPSKLVPKYRSKEPSPESDSEEEIEKEFEDLTCIERLTEHFKPSKILGVGAYGITFLLQDTHTGENEMVLKIQNTDVDSYREIVNSLMIVNNFNIAIFTRILNWNICQTFPSQWKQKFLYNEKDIEKQLKETKGKEEKKQLETKLTLTKQAKSLFNNVNFHAPYSYITMERNDVNIRDVMLSDDEVKCICFILLHGIMSAKKIYPYFNHSDIHGGNVMLNYHDTDTDIVLDNGKYIIKNLQFFPKLIDYGRMRFSKPNSENEQYKELKFHRYSNGTKMPPVNDVYRIISFFNKHEFEYKFWLDDSNFEMRIIRVGFGKGGYKNVITDEFQASVFDKLQHEDKYTSNWRDILELLNSKELQSPNIEHHEEAEPSFKRTKAFCNSCYSQNAKWTYHNTRDSYFFCDAKCAEKFEHIRKILPIKK